MVGEPPAGRWAGWRIYTDGSKAEGPRAGAGSGRRWDSPAGSPALRAPTAETRGTTRRRGGPTSSSGVQNALRAELVALGQPVSGSRDAAPMVAFTHRQSAIYMVARYWRLPHTMTHHHEHDLVKGVVSGLARTHRSTW